MSDPDRDPTEKPTTSKREAEAETRSMTRNWIGIAVVSILMLVLLTLAAMQATGLVDVLGPFADGPVLEWGVIAVLALAAIVLGGWSWKSIAG